jgi:hypothetical protein
VTGQYRAASWKRLPLIEKRPCQTPHRTGQAGRAQLAGLRRRARFKPGFSGTHWTPVRMPERSGEQDARALRHQRGGTLNSE